MADFYYREESKGAVPKGPYETADEARKAARYRGVLKVEVLKRAGAGFETVESKPAAGAAR